jgi:hypothetical protein
MRSFGMRIHPIFHVEHLTPYTHPNFNFPLRTTEVHPIDTTIPPDTIYEEEKYLE